MIFSVIVDLMFVVSDLLERLSRNAVNRLPSLSTFLEAFDRVWHDSLLNKLLAYRSPVGTKTGEGQANPCSCVASHLPCTVIMPLYPRDMQTFFFVYGNYNIIEARANSENVEKISEDGYAFERGP